MTVSGRGNKKPRLDASPVKEYYERVGTLFYGGVLTYRQRHNAMLHTEKQTDDNPKNGSFLCSLALVLAILAILLSVAGFFPCLGWLALIPAFLLALLAFILGVYVACNGAPWGPVILSLAAFLLLSGAVCVQLLFRGWVDGTVSFF